MENNNQTIQLEEDNITITVSKAGITKIYIGKEIVGLVDRFVLSADSKDTFPTIDITFNSLPGFAADKKYIDMAQSFGQFINV